MLPSLTDGVDTGGGGEVGGEVGAVLQGGAPALGGEGAAHPEAPGAGPLGHPRPLRALLLRVARAIEPQPRTARRVREPDHRKEIEKSSVSSLVCLHQLTVHCDVLLLLEETEGGVEDGEQHQGGTRLPHQRGHAPSREIYSLDHDNVTN